MIRSGDKGYERNNYSAWQRVTEPQTVITHLARTAREDPSEEEKSEIRSKDVKKPIIHKKKTGGIRLRELCKDPEAARAHKKLEGSVDGASGAQLPQHEPPCIPSNLSHTNSPEDML